VTGSAATVVAAPQTRLAVGYRGALRSLGSQRATARWSPPSATAHITVRRRPSLRPAACAAARLPDGSERAAARPSPTSAGPVAGATAPAAEPAAARLRPMGYGLTGRAAASACGRRSPRPNGLSEGLRAARSDAADRRGIDGPRRNRFAAAHPPPPSGTRLRTARAERASPHGAANPTPRFLRDDGLPSGTRGCPRGPVAAAGDSPLCPPRRGARGRVRVHRVVRAVCQWGALGWPGWGPRVHSAGRGSHRESRRRGPNQPPRFRSHGGSRHARESNTPAVRLDTLGGTRER